MTETKRLIINTISQHLRTAINIAMSLYSTRLAMEALGKSGYGVYMLIGGIVSLLLYITTSMVVTTQRHLSYSYGKGEHTQSSIIFQNSYILHCILGLAISACFLSITSLLFEGHFLNIDASQATEARYVYYIVITTVFLTCISAPCRALLPARENIVYISIIDILDGMLKLALTFLLFYITEYRLTCYAIILSSVMLFNFLALSIYSKIHYKEASLLPHPLQFSKAVQRQLIGFATWTLYGTLSIFLRAQGIAVVLNRIYGAIINAAYGIATQIFGAIQAISQAILNAITPQIVKAEGSNDRDRMLFLSQQACKYCFFLLAIFAIPLLFEMDTILHIWLIEPPEHANTFCRIFIIASLIDQITIGLNVSIQALGKIRNYTLTLYTVKLLTVPIVWILLQAGFTIQHAMLSYILMELIAALLRLPYAKHYVSLGYNTFLRTVISKLPLPTCAMLLTSYATCLLPHFTLRFLLTGILSALAGIAALWFFGLEASEKTYILSSIKKRGRKA